MISVEDINRLEELSVKNGVSTKLLMERAGKAFFDHLDKTIDVSSKTAIIFAGQGNNAGDGFVLARHLAKHCFVFIFLYGDENKFSGETASAYSRLAGNDHIEIMKPSQLDPLTIKKIKKTDHLLLIDALVGLGLKGPINPALSGGVDMFNSMRGYKVALDIPSGVHPMTGEHGPFVCMAEHTLTLFDKKPGLMGLKNVAIVPLAFAPEAVEKYKRELSQRGPIKGI